MNSLENIVSIRYGAVHINPKTWEQTNCGSKNKAKSVSRQFGGAGKVIAARDSKHLAELKKAFEEKAK